MTTAKANRRFLDALGIFDPDARDVVIKGLPCGIELASEAYMDQTSMEVNGPRAALILFWKGTLIGLQRLADVQNRRACCRCNRCHRPMGGSTAYDGACKCGGLIEVAPPLDRPRCPECRVRFATRFEVAHHIAKEHSARTARSNPLTKRRGPHRGKVGTPRNTHG